jgi:hypothetical protein
MMRAPHALQKRASSAFFAPQAWQKLMEARVWHGAHPAAQATAIVLPVRSLLVISMLGLASVAQADDVAAVHGRLDHDLVLTGALGGGVVLNDRVHPGETGALSLELRARVLDMAGVVLAGEWRPEGDSRLVVAADLRPLFLARWLLGASLHRDAADLLIDSLGLELGAAFGPFDGAFGVALAIGFGFDVPLYVGPHADGLFLRLSARHVTAGAGDQAAPRGGTSDWLLGAAIGGRFSVASGIAEWEPERYEVRAPE